MNWRLILFLSIFGVAVGFAGVLGLPGRTEALMWLIIIVICAVAIVQKTSGKYFLHAFITSIISRVWVGIIHAVFISTYLTNHHVIRGIYRTMPLSSHRRILTIIAEPAIGLSVGVIAGLITFGVGKIMKKNEPATQS